MDIEFRSVCFPREFLNIYAEITNISDLHLKNTLVFGINFKSMQFSTAWHIWFNNDHLFLLITNVTRTLSGQESLLLLLHQCDGIH